MHHFFVEQEQIRDGQVRITGPDVNHMKNVLRMRPGEEFLVSGGGNDLLCAVESLDVQSVGARILGEQPSRELPAGIWLFQGLPKSDKMELIIQKAVELGAAGIIPVATKNAVVKLDAKKEESRLRRWQAIAESAAKQSKRSLVPEIGRVLSFKEAVARMDRDSFDLRLLPYENERGMEATREAFARAGEAKRIAVCIGPEGGFDENEVNLARSADILPVSLGKRILRTETAGLAVLAALMLRLEGGI